MADLAPDEIIEEEASPVKAVKTNAPVSSTTTEVRPTPASPVTQPKPQIQISTGGSAAVPEERRERRDAPAKSEALTSPVATMDEAPGPTGPSIAIKRLNSTLKALHPSYRASAATQGPPPNNSFCKC